MKRMILVGAIFALALTSCGKSVSITIETSKTETSADQTTTVQNLDCRFVQNPEPPAGLYSPYICIFNDYEVSVFLAEDKCWLYDLILNSGSFDRDKNAVHDLYILTPDWTFGSDALNQDYLNQLRAYIGDNYSTPVTSSELDSEGHRKIADCEYGPNVIVLQSSEPLFTSPEGHEIHYRNFIQRVFKKAAIKAELPYITFHDLTRTHATILIAYGASQKVVQEHLGHRSISTTLALYAQGTEQGHIDEANATQQYLVPMSASHALNQMTSP